jgi:hypothetical protein
MFPYWCFGKTPYHSKAEALERIRCQTRDKFRRRAKGWCGDQEMLPYRCSSCGQWHVGAASRIQAENHDKFGRPRRRRMATARKEADHGRPKGA